MTDHNANPASLSAVLKQAKGGDVIRLSGEDYPASRPTKGMLKPEGVITLAAADPAKPPRFMGGMTLDQASSIRFVGIDFDISSASAEYAGAVSNVGPGAGLEFLGCRFSGIVRPDGERWGRGLVLSGVVGVKVVGCTFDRLFRGAVFGGCEDFLVDHCDFSDLGSDGLNLGQAKDARITRNQFSGFSPTGGDHPDGIQLATGKTGTGCVDVLIEDNLIACGIGHRNQGIFTRNENLAARHKGITVRRNVLVNSGNHAIAVGGADDILVEDNAALFQLIPLEFQPATGFANKSWIKTDTSNGVVRNNRAMTFIPNKASVNASNVEIPAATQAETDAAIAAWRANFRAPAKPGEPEIEPPARDVIGDLIRQSTVVKREALKTKGRVSFDWKTPAEADAFLAAVQALRAAA